MIYLSAAWTPTLADAQEMGYFIGTLCTPVNGAGSSFTTIHQPKNKTPYGRIPWAADTGIFGKTPFSLTRYLHKLEQWRFAQEQCLFATAPDVVADWSGTLEQSLPVIPAIKELGYPVALVLQNGATSETVPWDILDAVFVGGTTEWKLSEDAYALVADAKRRGLWAHMGRVNSLRRLQAADIAGYDSADGTYIAYGPDLNSRQLLSWLDNLTLQPRMKLVSGG